MIEQLKLPINVTINTGQGATGTKVHNYIEGQFCFVYIVSSGLISIFLYIGRVQISCGLLPTRIFLKFSNNTTTVKKVKFQICFCGKNHEANLPAAHLTLSVTRCLYTELSKYLMLLYS